jgi:ATP synthase protein I
MAQRPDEAPEQEQQPAGRTRPPTWVAMSGLGFEFVGAILVPGALGWWLDRLLGTAPWIMLALGLLGFAAGLRLLMRSVNRPPRG